MDISPKVQDKNAISTYSKKPNNEEGPMGGHLSLSKGKYIRHLGWMEGGDWIGKGLGMGTGGMRSEENGDREYWERQLDVGAFLG